MLLPASAETSPLKTSVRFDVLDILKAICAVFVIIAHTSFTVAQRKHFYFSLHVDMAVPIFMIIMGFTFTLSAEKRGLSSLTDWFSKENFGPKFSRIFLPYLTALILEGIYFATQQSFSPMSRLLYLFINGGLGPGSYYVPVLVQFLLIFPLIFLFFKHSPIKCATAVLAANFLFEILCRSMNLSAEFYRISFLRYLTFILLGMILFFYREKLQNTFIPVICLLGGLIYLININYLGFQPKIFSSWKNTSMMIAPFVFAIVYYVMRMKNKFLSSSFLAPVRLAGKASFHIFLTQQVFYATKYPNMIFDKYGLKIQAVANVVICIGLGILFFILQERAKVFISHVTCRKR